MADRGPDQDRMPVGGTDERQDATYRDASYLGTSENDDEEVRDLGFIVDDHDDRRATLTGGWQRLDDLDTDEPLETNRSGKIPHATALRERGAPGDWFATDYHVENAAAEAQEEDFVKTSLLPTDPDMNEGMDDFTDETMTDTHGAGLSTDITGRVTGVGEGSGTAITQDMGRGGFDVRDNPLVEDAGDQLAIAGREQGYELDDYDDDKQVEPRDRLDVGALGHPPEEPRRRAGR
jgi:hypothetical protein